MLQTGVQQKYREAVLVEMEKGVSSDKVSHFLVISFEQSKALGKVMEHKLVERYFFKEKAGRISFSVECLVLLVSNLFTFHTLY